MIVARRTGAGVRRRATTVGFFAGAFLRTAEVTFFLGTTFFFGVTAPNEAINPKMTQAKLKTKRCILS